MKKLLIILLLVTACKKNAPIDDFSKLYTIKSRFDEKTSTLVVDISLDNRIHAYAEGEEVGIPVKFELSPKNGWLKDGEAIVPKGKAKNLSLGKSVVLEGDFKLSQKLKKGQGPGEGTLYLQVCSSDSCDKPKEHTINFE